MARYRYRTPALAGRWRDTLAAALSDAVDAKQAAFDAAAPGGLRWLVRGEIEQESEAEAASSARRTTGN